MTEHWGTPLDLFRELNAEFDFDLDPCASSIRTLKIRMTEYHYGGLDSDWFGSVFVNPPYGRETVKWVKYALKQIDLNRAKVVVMLVPNNTDAPWFHNYIYQKHEVRFIRGRVRFVDLKGSKSGRPRHGSMILVLRARSQSTYDERVSQAKLQSILDSATRL